MWTFVLWLLSVFFGCFLLNWIIRSAIDGSVIGSMSTELQTMSSSIKREQQEMRQQVAELTALINVQNEAIKSMKSSEGSGNGSSTSSGTPSIIEPTSQDHSSNDPSSL